MLLMKESVLSFEEETTQLWFAYFQIAGKYKLHTVLIKTFNNACRQL